MPDRSVPAMLVAAALGLSPLSASAQSLPGDHLIVPGVRIGAALLEQADQGALVRALGEPDQTSQRGDHEYYRYGAPPSDSLTVEFDLAKDAPFEISTASLAYRTRDGVGVGSSVAEVHTALGAPVCEGGTATGAGLIVYGAIWFRVTDGSVTGVAIRKAISPADLRALPIHC
jgi:hypothetical protein